MKKVNISDIHKYSGYCDKNGLFCILNKIKKNNIIISFQVGENIRCREVFANHFVFESEYIGFNCSGLELKNFIKFWSYITKKLGKKYKLTFYQAIQNQNLIIIKVPSTWRENCAVRSVLTLFLRASTYYSGEKKIEICFKKYHLSFLVIPAINWFLKGNTEPVYPFHGFVTRFHNASDEFLRKSLVKP